MLTSLRLIQKIESKNPAKAVKSLIKAFFILFVFSLARCSSSKKIDLDPESRNFYDTARLIMTKQEKDIFNHLPDKEARKDFIVDFWVKRDPDVATEVNEFREEFLRRIEYANQRFKEGIPGWKTDRGRIYIYFGPPDKIDQRPFINDPDIKGYILWVYYKYNLGVEFIDKKGHGSYTLNPYSGIYGSFFDALERAKLGQIFRTEDGLKNNFFDFMLEFNEENKEILVSIPTSSLTFIEEDGLLKADFEFEFYIYEKKEGEKKRFYETRHFERSEEEVLGLENIIFTFSFNSLKPGKYYFDVVIIGKRRIGKTRKIFEIKV